MDTATSPSKERRRGEPAARRHSGSLTHQYDELEAFEREYTIERFTQRDLMLNLATTMWFFTIFAVMVAGRFAATGGDPFPESVRYCLVALSIVNFILLMTVVRRLDDQRANHALTVFSLLGIAVYVVLSFYGPGALGGTIVTLMGATIFAAQFLSRRSTTLITAVATISIVYVAVVNHGNAEAPYILSHTSMQVIVLWAVAYSIYTLKQARRDALDAAERAGFADGLTNLPNTRMMRRKAAGLLDSRNQRINRRIGVVMLDLDGFRAAKMLRGHRVGDRILVAVAEAIKRSVAPADIVCRTGSDEFTVLVPDCSEEQLHELGERLRTVTREAVHSVDLAGVNIDVSIGSALSGAVATIDELTGEAEHAMYLEKAAHERSSNAQRSLSASELIAPPAGEGEPPVALPGGRFDHLRWSQRSIQNRILSAFWVMSGFGCLIATSMPDAPAHNELLVNLTVVFAVISGVVIYVIPPAQDFARQLVDVLFASVTLSFFIWISGQSVSPGLSIELLILIYIGWFLPLRSVVPVAGLSVFIVLLPMLFTENRELGIADFVTIYGSLVIAGSLLGVLYFNHYYIERGRNLTDQLRSLDPRAGTYSRIAFEERMEDELDLLSYGDRDALAVVMVDLGNFKSVTANHGRASGDRVLTEVASALTEASRDEDCVARLGGDEFAIIAPGVDAESARALSQRLVNAVRELLEESDLPASDELRPSAGFALYGMHGRTTDQLVTAADVALTAAKTSSRDPNRVSSFVVAL